MNDNIDTAAFRAADQAYRDGTGTALAMREQLWLLVHACGTYTRCASLVGLSTQTVINRLAKLSEADRERLTGSWRPTRGRPRTNTRNGGPT